MVEVKLIIPRKYWFDKTVKFTLPSTWLDIKTNDRLKILALLSLGDRYNQLPQIVEVLFGSRSKYLKQLDTLQMYDIIQHLDFIQLKGTPDLIIPSCDGVSIKTGDKFEHGTAYQYATLLDLYAELVAGNEDKLYHIVSLISDTPVKNCYNLPDGFMTSVILYIEGIQNYIYETYKSELFPDSDGDSGSSQPNFGWWGVYFDVADGLTFGALDQVYSTNFHKLCFYLFKKSADNKAAILRNQLHNV